MESSEENARLLLVELSKKVIKLVDIQKEYLQDRDESKRIYGNKLKREVRDCASYAITRFADK